MGGHAESRLSQNVGDALGNGDSVSLVGFANFKNSFDYTANLFTAKIAGFRCVQIPTALSLHFLQSLNVCSGSLHSVWSEAKTCND